MLVAFIVAAHERDRAMRLAQWIEELGAGRGHSVLLCVTQAAQRAAVDSQLAPILQRAFDSYSLMIPFDSVEVPWGAPVWDASSANHLFTRVNRHVDQHLKCPYLYLEMDAIPTRATVFTEIEAEYVKAAKVFMGDRVDNGRHPVHMSGVAVYPADIINNSRTLAAIDWNCYPMADPRKTKLAWDIASCREVVPKAHFTPLIQHSYQYTEPCRAPELWNGTAALFHQCKCGCLIEKLRNENVPRGTIEVEPAKETVPKVQYPPNTIFTYFQPLPSIDAEEQLALIELWKASWSRAGWNPVVLDGSKYGGIAGTLTDLPSVNPAGYDAACLTRWLAMAEHGGWMSDYDVMCNGLPPQPIPARLTVYQVDDPVPALVAGPASEFLRMAKLFAQRGPALVGSVNGRPHVSDMHLLQKLAGEYDQESIVLEHGRGDWQHAGAIHFANQSMEGKKPRSEWIPRLLPAPPQAVTPVPATNGHRSISERIREHIDGLALIVDGQTGRKAMMRGELRKARLLR